MSKNNGDLNDKQQRFVEEYLIDLNATQAAPGDSVSVPESLGRLVRGISVDTSSKRDPDATYWLSVLAFGDQAEILLKHQAGDSIGVVGRMQRNKWKDREGIEHEGLQLVVDTLTSSRTIRPGGRKVKKQQVQEQGDMLPPPDEEMRF